MAAWTVGAVSFADPLGISNAAGLVAGRYWLGNVRAGAPEFERRLYGFPGVDGLGVKRFGFRGRTIAGEVAYLQAGLAVLQAAFEADRAALADTLFSTTLPDGAAHGHCQVARFEAQAARPAGQGLLLLRAALALRQVR